MIFAEIFKRKYQHLNRGVSMILKSQNPKSPPGSEDTRYWYELDNDQGTETVARDSADCAKPWLYCCVL